MDEDKSTIKERIFEVATRLFAQKGFDGLSIDELAKEAKINKSMIYYYFSNKEGLLITIIQNHLREFEEEFNKLDFSGVKDTKNILTNVIKLAVDYISQHMDLVTIIFHETFVKASKARIDIINFINPVWDKIEKTLKHAFPGLGNVAMVDRLLCISLVGDFVLIINRIDSSDEEGVAAVKGIFIKRVTRIMEYLLTDRDIV
ncbi:MAG: TetR/AcrR family transcriptional regulator [Spirochaetales bacterium]|nr:TetR/AcrR family transcriptional regulator [Spirochaetales bacterium]